jgi:hypothetical protein
VVDTEITHPLTIKQRYEQLLAVAAEDSDEVRMVLEEHFPAVIVAVEVGSDCQEFIEDEVDEVVLAVMQRPEERRYRRVLNVNLAQLHGTLLPRKLGDRISEFRVCQ